MLERFFNVVLQSPKVLFGLVVLCILALGYQAQKLEIDASSETLLLEDDEDLQFTRIITERYYSPDFLVVTYSPKNGDLLDESTLTQIRNLSEELERLDRVESAVSILNVPLLESPPKPVRELLEDIPTLESEGIDKALAKQEFLNSPIYRDNLVSPDFKTTAILLNLKDDPKYRQFLQERNRLRGKEKEGSLTPAERKELEQLLIDFKKYRDALRIIESDNVAQVRAIVEAYKEDAQLFLGGATMIADDLITFVKSDLQLFGIGVLIILVITLFFIFREKRWVFLPVLTCFFSVIATSGLLGMFHWEVTVISSNFISIQIIMTMALTIHLTVRYRELALRKPDESHHQLVLEAVVSMWKPCFFAVITTVAGFSSLILSGILPIINFGWMMSAGIGVSLIITFLVFPSILILMEKRTPNVSFEKSFTLNTKLATLTEKHGNVILVLSFILVAFSISGSTQLRVENSFIDYFKDSTEIHQGMKVIDQQLGGTTPLDIILNFDQPINASKNEAAIDQQSTTPDPEIVAVEEESFEEESFEEESFEEEGFGEEGFGEEGFGEEGFGEEGFEDEFAENDDLAKYWFTSDKMEKIEKVHDYIDGLPETGKVLSLGTMLKVGKVLNNGEPLDNFLLALIYEKLPEEFRNIILSPYLSIEDDQVRFSIRIRDSEPDLRRNELIQQINRELETDLELAPSHYRLSSLLILYNNMLQSLFSSQILTLGVVLAVLMFMFLILFRSIKIACIAIFPNILSIGVILGFMGWFNIPLDLMTITIASISMGIAVDDTIHYIHRFKNEFEKTGSYLQAMHKAHRSIGYAMGYTSLAIIIGFSVLVLSNFIPSIYFGLLTGLAMFVALISSLTLLPQLLIVVKPYGSETPKVP